MADIEELKAGLNDKNAPFGVDLLLPKVGAGARKTNKDYTEGNLPELVSCIYTLYLTIRTVPTETDMWMSD